MFERDSLVRKTLTVSDMREFLDEKNEHNREMKETRVNKYVREIKNQKWNFNFLEGKLVVVDCSNGDLLSGQHRMEAILRLGIESWDVYVSYVDRDEWVAKSIEKRTNADIVNMSSPVEIPKQLGDAIAKCGNQYNFLTGENPYTSTSGSSGNNKIPPEEMGERFSVKALAFYDAVPKAVKQNKASFTALLALHLADKISIDTVVSDFKKVDTRLGSAQDWLVETHDWGSKVTSLPFGTAVYYHALNTTINEDYNKVDSKCKPQYTTKNAHYHFDTYE